MREMKDSGIEWIGEIPKDWEVVRTKNISDISIGLVTTMTSNYVDDVEEGVPLIRNGNIRCNYIDSKGMVYLSRKFAEQNSHRLLRKGHIATVHTGDIGTSVVIDEEYDCSMGFATIQSIPHTDKVYTKYLCWYYNSEVFKMQCIAFCTGDGRQNLNLYDFVDFKVILPSIREQKLISDYIDKKCIEIDNLTADIQKQIDTLEQYKKSVITEAVTKGLNPDVEMKDSGIEWIGEIPKVWSVCKIKHLFANNKDGIKVGPFGSSLGSAIVSKDEGEYKVYGQANLIRRDFTYGENYVKEDDYKRLRNYEVLSDDIAVSMMGTIGKCCVVPQKIEKGIMDSHLIKIRIKSDYNPKYFEYLYESDAVFTQLILNNKGTIMTGLNSSIVKNIYFLQPCINEQTDIVNYLDKKCSEIDSIISDKKKQLETLEQYKKSLIYEYVTGKKEVPNE